MHPEQFFWYIFDITARWVGVECIWIDSGVAVVNALVEAMWGHRREKLAAR